MLEESFERLYLLFRANYYKRMVEVIGTREGSLSATESYCVEIIYLLNRPTISQFAQFLRISVPNATYKIGSLIEKGYVKKVPSPADKRETHLTVTEKFLNYYGLRNQDNAHMMRQIHRNFSQAEIEALDATIRRIVALIEAPESEEQL